MESFGNRLRAARRRAGLSQVEVGGDKYSGSYVSHLESERRQPTLDMAEYFALRMHVPLTELLGDAQQGSQLAAGEIDTMVADLNARTAWMDHDFEQASKEAERAASAAQRSRRVDSWWASTSLRAQSLLAVGQYERCWQLAEMLAEHHVAAPSGAMRAEMLALASKARRADGQLIEATVRAEAAIAAGLEPPTAYAPLAHAYMAAISALGETRRLEDSLAIAERLRAVREHIESQHLRGLIAWTLGNLEFLADDVARAESEHAIATELLKPEVNLRSWARFRYASATMRMSAGIFTGVRAQLDQARLALSLVGHPGDLLSLDLGFAQLAIGEEDFGRAVEIIDEVLAEPNTPPSNLRAEAGLVRAQALSELGRTGEAQQAVMLAATLFEEAGAYPRALAAWKLHADLTHPGGWHVSNRHAGLTAAPQP